MADPWNEQREREWREARRRDRRYDSGRDYGGEAYGGGPENRSFQGRDGFNRDPYATSGREHDHAPRGPVFGEHESGANYGDEPTGSRYGSNGYTGPRYGAGGYTGYGERPERPYRADPDGAGRRPAYDEGRSGPFGGERPGYYGDRDAARGREVGPPDRGFWDKASDRVAAWLGDSNAEARSQDDRQASHRGRGPEGYRRSDERIAEDVHERLTDDPWVDASRIRVAVSGGEVTLSGVVSERDAKHRAEHIVEAISGVGHVQNDLRIDKLVFFNREEPYGGASVRVSQMKADDGSPTPGGAKGVN
jgi:hypothetical protein